MFLLFLEFFSPLNEMFQYPNPYGTDESEFPSCWYCECVQIQMKEVSITKEEPNDFPYVNPVKEMNF